MGKEYFKRPLAVNMTTAASTVSSFDDVRVAGAMTVAGVMSQTGNLTLSADFTVPTESLTGTAANQTLSDHGVSFLTVATSNLTNDFVLPDPPRAGAVKYVFVNFATTSGDEFALHAGATVAGSSADVFWGTTSNTITGNAIAAGTIPVGGTPGLLLIGVSTNQWAVSILGSTVLFNMTASTGSTSQN